MIYFFKILLQDADHLTLSSDYLKGTGANFKHHILLLQALYLLRYRVDRAISFMDPQHYRNAAKLKKKVEERFPFARMFADLDPCVYEGLEILLNVHTGLHTDRFDPFRGWALVYCAGNHTGGYLNLPHLGLRLRMLPGDMTMIRGRVLKHCVEDWSGGQRISIPHYTHSSTWRMMEMDQYVGGEYDGDEWVDED